MLDMAILGLLEARDLHGYEIRRQLRDNLGILANVSFGSIYPALTRLEKVGRRWWPPKENIAHQTPRCLRLVPRAPPTGSLSGELAVLRARRHSATHSRRGKKVYRITEKGTAALRRVAGPGRLSSSKTPAASASGSPSPGISPPKPASPFSSAAGPSWSSA